MSVERILVTGAAGFIGRHIYDVLKEYDYDVRAFDIINTSYSIVVPGEDVNRLSDVKAAVKNGCSGVIHLAAISRERMALEAPVRCIETNILGTLNVLEAARLQKLHPWVILASTRDVPSGTYTAQSLYGASWLSAEILARRYVEDYGLRVLVLRLSDVYGSERDHKDKVLPTLIRQAVAEEPLTVDISGRLFDFTHYMDVQRAFALSVDWILQHSGFHSVTICTGQSTTVKELAQLILRRTSSRAPIILQGESCGDVQIHNDPKPAFDLLGFKTQILLEDGIDMLVKSMREKATV